MDARRMDTRRAVMDATWGDASDVVRGAVMYEVDVAVRHHWQGDDVWDAACEAALHHTTCGARCTC